jgi:Shikimate 5-dehydrogenase
MKRFGLIGNPVAGSLSPRLFEAAYGGRYTYDLIEGAEFAASWQRFLDEYDGINITAPSSRTLSTPWTGFQTTPACAAR